MELLKPKANDRVWSSESIVQNIENLMEHGVDRPLLRNLEIINIPSKLHYQVYVSYF